MRTVVTTIIIGLLLPVILYSQDIIYGSNRPDTTQFVSSALKWQDLRVPLTATKAGGSNDPTFVKVLATGTSQGVFAHSFSGVTEQELYFVAQFPHGFAKTCACPHVHFMAADTDVATVVWALEYAVYNIASSGPAATEILSVATLTSGVALQHQMVELPDIDASNIHDSATIICRFFRDATNDADTAGAVFGVEIDFHYQTNVFGSVAENGDDNP